MLKVLNVIAELIAGFSRWFFSTRIPLWLGTIACLVFILERIWKEGWAWLQDKLRK